MDPSLETTIALLARTPAAVDALLRRLPEALTHSSEGDGTWTATDVVGHLVHGERTDWLPRLRIVLEHGAAQTFPPFDRLGHRRDVAATPLDGLLDTFAQLRAENLRLLAALDLRPEHLRLQGRHPAFGLVTLSELLATWAAHDLTHLHQISRILAHQYRGAVGPWARYLGVLHCDGHSAPA
jgi:hypothetical protein